MKKIILLIIFFSFWNFANSQTINHWETAVFKNDTWRYFVGTSEPDANWRSISFNDTGWPQGPGGFGFSDNDDNTVIPQCTSVFIRCKFNVPDTSSIAKALLSMDYDDAFVAYLNDVEIARSGIIGVHPTYNQTGTDHEATVYSGGLPESFVIDKKHLKICLLQGENLLAIQVHNTSSASSDMSSNAFLSLAITNTSNYFHPVPDWFNPPFDFTSSNLPIVVIITKSGETIKNEPKITADMKIIHNGSGKRNYVSDPGNIYTGKVGIEIRGKYSASLPQKPYGFETRDIAGNNLNVSLLGMPPENDWVLLANYNDKTFLRNVLAFDIFEKMGNYATRTRYCEVVLNNEYQGIYLLGEKIKVDDERVNISKLKPEDNTGNDLTGGYIINNDYYTATDSWMSRFSPLNKPAAKVYFVYYDPKPDELTTLQKTYIQEYINSLETILYSPYFKVPVFGYKAYIDTKSFSDYFIIGEVSRNVDAYKKSRFYYKNKDSKGGLLHSGPVWDFDWAWRNLKENCVHFNKTDGSGWAYKVNECDAWPVPPSWEIRLLQDNEFANLIHARYFALRKTILSQARIDHSIDSVVTLIDEAQKRHFQKWKILGINVGTPESDTQPSTFSGEIEKFKNWISTRLAWLDANMVGSASSININGSIAPAKCRIFPNPVSDILYIESDKEIKNFALFNIVGIKVEERINCYNFSVTANVAHLHPGIYLAKIQFSSGEIITIKVVKK